MLKNIKSYFPIFATHPNLSYLDNAATTQTPQVVIDAMNDYYTKYRANTHRGMYDIAVKATDEYEGARATVAKFLNAETNEIIFTSGTTHGLNALAYTLCGRLTHRDNVVLTRLEHHANLVPWQQMAKHYGFEIRFIELQRDLSLPSPLLRRGGSDSFSPLQRREREERFDSPYSLDIESAKKIIDANTKIVSFTLASNVLGTVNPAKEIIALAKKFRAITIIDAAQAIAHFPIDVKDIDCDWLVFSGHKMYGPTGTGVLFGKKIMLEENIEPFMFGGDMVLEVSYENATWTEVPQRFEAGTQNIASVIGLGAAVKFIQKIGWESIMKHETELTGYLLEKLQENDVQIIGPSICHSERSEESLPSTGQPTEIIRFTQDDSLKPPNRIGVVSFTLPGIHPHDLAEILNQNNVAIRAGHHCAMPLHTHLALTATARASLGVYSTKEDVDKLIEGIKQAREIFT